MPSKHFIRRSALPPTPAVPTRTTTAVYVRRCIRLHRCVCRASTEYDSRIQSSASLSHPLAEPHTCLWSPASTSLLPLRIGIQHAASSACFDQNDQKGSTQTARRASQVNRSVATTAVERLVTVALEIEKTGALCLLSLLVTVIAIRDRHGDRHVANRTGLSEAESHNGIVFDCTTRAGLPPPPTARGPMKSPRANRPNKQPKNGGTFRTTLLENTHIYAETQHTHPRPDDDGVCTCEDQTDPTAADMNG